MVKAISREEQLYSLQKAQPTDYSYREFGDNTCFADQFPAQDFNRNSFGWPMSDISALNHANSQAEFDAILSRMKELSVDNSQASLTDRQKLALVRPRILQDPTELARYHEFVIRSLTPEPSVDSGSGEPGSGDSGSGDSGSGDSGSGEPGSGEPGSASK